MPARHAGAEGDAPSAASTAACAASLAAVAAVAAVLTMSVMAVVIVAMTRPYLCAGRLPVQRSAPTVTCRSAKALATTAAGECRAPHCVHEASGARGRERTARSD